LTLLRIYSVQIISVTGCIGGHTTMSRIVGNTRLVALGTLAILPLIPIGALAQASRGAGVPSAEPPIVVDSARPASAPKPALADLAWLAGRWQGAWGPRVAQQEWTPPKAGVMVGSFQLAENDKTLVLEFVTLVEEGDGIKFHLRHFTPSLVAWEKPGPTILDLTAADPKVIAFENPTDGQPKRLTFIHVDTDTYVSRSEVVPQQGDPQVTEITYRRQKEAPPARRKGPPEKDH
jgi:Domain of unknown function (DUF6265)